MQQTQPHKSVLKDEALTALRIAADGIYIDGTFGRGGHAREILAQLGENGRLLALDADLAAVESAQQQFGGEPRFTVHHSNFATLAEICAQEKLGGAVDGVLLDLGVSSPQLDEAGRGFSFTHDGPLDMRMDATRGEPASAWLARVSEKEMADVFWQYGEERYSRRIARALVQQRKRQHFARTVELAEAVKAAHPRWEKGKHPATRVFQAIRIHVNRELESLNKVLAGIVEVLKIGGRLVVISFHSLEDRVVKRFARGDGQRVAQPRGLPVQEKPWPLRPVGKKIRPTTAEIDANPRARSAVLRTVERVA